MVNISKNEFKWLTDGVKGAVIIREMSRGRKREKT